MSVVDMVGWIAALSSASLAVPQGARIAMTRSVAGVSTITWQTMLIAGICWTAHGLLYGTPQILWPNMLLAVTSAWVLWQLTVARRLPAARTWLIPVASAGLAVSADLTLGPLPFAVCAFAPSAVGQIAQLREILRAPDPSGVSMVALLANLLNQVLWFSYALPAGEVAVLASSPPVGCIVAVSVTALWVRRKRIALRQRHGSALRRRSPNGVGPAAGRLGTRRNRVGTRRNRVGMHGDGVGTRRNRVGMHGDGVGMHGDRLELAEATLTQTVAVAPAPAAAVAAPPADTQNAVGAAASVAVGELALVVLPAAEPSLGVGQPPAVVLPAPEPLSAVGE